MPGITVSFPADTPKAEQDRLLQQAVMAALTEGFCYRCGEPLEPDEYIDADAPRAAWHPGLGGCCPDRFHFTTICRRCQWRYHVCGQGFSSRITDELLSALTDRQRRY